MYCCEYVLTWLHLFRYIYVCVSTLYCLYGSKEWVCVFVFVHMLRLFYRFCNSPRRGLVAWLCGIFCMTCRETGLQRMALKLKLLLVITITSCWAIISNVNNISYVAHLEFSLFVFYFLLKTFLNILNSKNYFSYLLKSCNSTFIEDYLLVVLKN